MKKLTVKQREILLYMLEQSEYRTYAPYRQERRGWGSILFWLARWGLVRGGYGYYELTAVGVARAQQLKDDFLSEDGKHE